MAGRPTKYKPEYCEMLIKHMNEGLSFESFAAVIKVNVDSLYEWNKRHAAFSEAKKKATAEYLIFWEKLFRGVAMGKIKGASATLIIFKMKCSFGYKDGSETNKQSDVRDDSNKVWKTRWANNGEKKEGN